MLRRISLGLASLIGLSAGTEVKAADVVLDWNSTLRSVMKLDGLHPVNDSNPGWSSRTVAMMNTSIYDVFQAKDRTHVPYLVDAQAAPDASVEAAVHRAAYEILLNCYPGEAPTIQAAYDGRIALIPDDVNRANGIALGTEVAQAAIANRTGDHSRDFAPPIRRWSGRVSGGRIPFTPARWRGAPSGASSSRLPSPTLPASPVRLGRRRR